jgi:hypothetical protein
MEIDFAPAESFRGTRLYRQANNLAYAYETNYTAVDADGAPNAYHPNEIGLDALANAGYPHSSWWKDVLVVDPNHPSRPFVQRDGPYQGYFVSMTSLRDPQGGRTDLDTYVDANRFPYVVLPTGFGGPHMGPVAKTGDVGIATHLNSGRTSTFIVGDSGGGTDAKLGEGSIALFIYLGGQAPNPRTGHGVPAGRIQYILFPGSRKPGAEVWPRTNQDIHDQVMELVAHTPGITQT